MKFDTLQDHEFRRDEWDARERESKASIRLPLCPTCGEEATYQTPDSTYWCASAHYWREKVNG